MVYSKIKEDLIFNTLFSTDTLFDYIEQRIDEEELSEYISEITITDGGNSSYDPASGEFCINKKEIFLNNIDKNIPGLEDLISEEEKLYYKIKNPNYSNIYNLFIINHELNHVIQKKYRHNDLDSLKGQLSLLGQTQAFIDTNFLDNYFTEKYHDRFINEYNAHIESYIEIIHLLSAYDLIELKKALIKTNKITARHILYMYDHIDKDKISNPIKNTLILNKYILEECKKHEMEIELDFYLNKEQIQEEKDKMSEFEKLRYGLPINNDTRKYLNDVANKKIKTLNLFDEIER